MSTDVRFTPKADIRIGDREVRYVPKADIVTITVGAAECRPK
jgi:hypothetical protein